MLGALLVGPDHLLTLMLQHVRGCLVRMLFCLEASVSLVSMLFTPNPQV